MFGRGEVARDDGSWFAFRPKVRSIQTLSDAHNPKAAITTLVDAVLLGRTHLSPEALQNRSATRHSAYTLEDTKASRKVQTPTAGPVESWGTGSILVVF